MNPDNQQSLTVLSESETSKDYIGAEFLVVWDIILINWHNLHRPLHGRVWKKLN